jgi:hypothetical protein
MGERMILQAVLKRFSAPPYLDWRNQTNFVHSSG